MGAHHRPKRLLVMPAGVFQAPAILAAKAMGLEVVAMDRNPKAPGLAFADAAEAVDPADVAEAVRVARTHDIDAVVTVASDPCVVPCARVAEALGLPGLSVEAARRARNKVLARNRLAETLPEYCPRYYVLQSEGDLARVQGQVGLPAVLKPAEGNGSKGVIRVVTRDRLDEGYAYARRFSMDGIVLAEELLAGREVSVEGIVLEDTTEIAAITDKIITPPPFCAETGHTIPSDLPRRAQEDLLAAVQRILGAFGLRHGGFHCELFVTEEGVRLVEVAARLAGGCIATHLVPLATGIDLVGAAIAMALGRRPHLERGRSAGAAIRFLTPEPGRVQSVSGVECALALPGIREVVLDVAPGHVVHPLENSDHRVGYVIAVGDDRRHAVDNVERAAAAVRIAVEPV